MKRVVCSIACGIGIACVFLLLKNQCAWRLLENANYGMPMLIEQKEIENLFLGSSTFRQGLDIMLIEEKLGKNSYILSYDGNQPAMEYLELKYLYEKGVKIKNLYVDFYVYTASDQFKISDKKIFMETDIGFKKELSMLLVREKQGLKSIVEMYISANNELLLTWPLSYPFINERFYKGGSLAEQAGVAKSVLDSLKVPEGSELNYLQMEYLMKLVELARENDTSVVFLEIPKYGSVMEDEGYLRLSQKMKDMLNKEDVYCIMIENGESRDSSEEIDFPIYKSKNYADLIHLSSEGKKSFTETLVEIIDE